MRDFLVMMFKYKIWRRKNLLTRIFPGDIRCASTVNAQRKGVACIIKPCCCRLRTVILGRRSFLRLGRTERASVFERRGLCRGHGVSGNSMITFPNGKKLRPARAYAHTSVVAVDRTTEFITVKTRSRQSSRKRS